MTQPSRQKMILVASAMMMFTLYVSSPSANHSWNGYHWARSSNPLSLNLGDNLSTNWDRYLATASIDWNKSTVLDIAVVVGESTRKNCRPADGKIEICNDAY